MSHVRNCDGFTLVEVMVSVAIIIVGFAGLLAAVPLASYGVQEGSRLSTATSLADQRLEQVRNATWSATPSADCLGVSLLGTTAPTVPVAASCPAPVLAAGATTFADETTIAGFPGYSRTVRVTDCSLGAGCSGVIDARLRLVTVSVTYTSRPGVGGSGGSKSLQTNLLVTRR